MSASDAVIANALADCELHCADAGLLSTSKQYLCQPKRGGGFGQAGPRQRLVRPAFLAGPASGNCNFYLPLTAGVERRIIHEDRFDGRGPGTMDSPIASTGIVYVPEDGGEIATEIQVGLPREEGEGSWACEVEIPDVERLRTIHGADSLHALLLALGFLSDRLEYLSENGASFLWPDTREPSRIADILPRLDTLVE